MEDEYLFLSCKPCNILKNEQNEKNFHVVLDRANVFGDAVDGFIRITLKNPRRVNLINLGENLQDSLQYRPKL